MIRILTLVFFISVNLFANTDSTLDKLKNIEQQANVANGNTSIRPFSLQSFNFESETQRILAKTQKNWGKRCGPYKQITTRRAVIDMIKGLPEVEVANGLAELYKDGKILKMYSITTNNEINCSQIWVHVYTVDGYHLALWYGLGD